jgi:hypothetical protein
MKFYESFLKFTKVEKSYDIPQYFSVKSLTFIPFHSIAMYYCNFVISYRDEQNFFCLLLYCFASRQHRQIFCHHQMKGDISNIADT